MSISILLLIKLLINLKFVYFEKECIFVAQNKKCFNMKRTTQTILLISALLLSACNSNSYHIEGTVTDPNIADSTKVYLSKYEQKLIHLDSTYVINGKFNFNGEADTAQNAYLGFIKDNKFQNIANFILEKGKIVAQIDTNFIYKITGTEQNDVLFEFSAKKKKMEKDLTNLIPKYRVSKGEKQDSLAYVLSEIQGIFYKEAYEYSLKYVNTIAGTNIFLNYQTAFFPEKKDEILSKMNEQTKSNPYIKSLIKQIEQEKKTAKGQPYIDFTLQNIAGKEVKLSDYIGKTDYLLVDFWASWCAPCLHSLPELKRFYKKHKGVKFDIVGVSLDNKKEDWEKAIKKHKIKWNHISDLKGWKSVAASSYSIHAIPSTVLIDKEGKIVGKDMPLMEIEELLVK